MWCLSLVTVVVVLPHKAVVTGLLARAVQAGVLGLGAVVLMVLREKGGFGGLGGLGGFGGGKGSTIVDFTLVPRERSY